VANELTLEAKFKYEDADGRLADLSKALTVNVANKKVTRFSQSVGVTDEPLELGDVTPGWLMLVNYSTVATFTLKNAAAGVAVATIPPGGCCLFRAGAGMQTPYVVASAAATLDGLIVNT
jgi:hypothetical protein